MRAVLKRLGAPGLVALVLAAGGGMGLAVAEAASADVRGGIGADPRDAPESLNGPRNTDIEQVRVTYDTTGSLEVTVRLYEPLEATNRSHTIFDIRIGSATFSDQTCSYYNHGDVSLYGALDGSQGWLHMSGFTGYLSPSITKNPSEPEYTFTASSPQLAGRNYICAGRSSLYRPDSDGHCSPSPSNCDHISYRYTGDEADPFFFDGFAPIPTECGDGLDNDGDGRIDTDDLDCTLRTSPSEGEPAPACSNHRDDDGDGLADLQDPGCKGRPSDADEQDPDPVASRFHFTNLKPNDRCRMYMGVWVSPDIKPRRLFPFGNVVVRVREVGGSGSRYDERRELPLRRDPGYKFKLAPGKYRITGQYLGDRFRHPSAVRARTVDICR